MSLLAPWFLFVALAITLPLWLHRLQTQSAVRRPFSSTMLLESTEKQVHVKKKLKYRVLLSMRVAMLLLLALILAKPIWTKTAPAFSESAATHVVLIDTSASMLRAGVFDRAVEAARNAIDSIPNGSLIQVVNADSRIHVAGELSADKAVHRSALATIEAGATRLDFGEAMGAIDTFAENLPPPVILHFVSDFQDSGMPIRFADLAATNIAELITHRVAVDARFNWRVEYARATAAVVDIGVIGSGEIAGRASVGAILNNRLVEQRDLVETGRSVHRFSGLQLEPGDNRLTVSIAAADDLAIDNEWYQVIEDTPPAPIPLITANRGRRAAMYLETALQADPRSNYRIEFMPVSETDFRTLSRYRWAVIDDLGSIGSELEAVIVSFIENGGNLLAFAGQGRAAAEQLPVSRHRVRATAVSANENEFLTIGQIDTGHPVLSDIEGWHSVNITRNIAVDVEDGDQVLIRLENATPFLIERRLGRGRILLLTSGLDNEWNDLPIRPVFVSFVVESARYLSGVGDTTKSFTTGDALPLSLIGGASGQVVDPQGNTVLSLVDTTREQQIRLEQPGFYEVYTPQGDYLVAVNTDPRESQAE
ncbi:MAG: BatA domain-containing protein, partial [Gammaproteobacteria bacterium]|nr:BatA domain-containing protein [Gammaproteobacteria bacterium]